MKRLVCVALVFAVLAGVLFAGEDAEGWETAKFGLSDVVNVVKQAGMTLDNAQQSVLVALNALTTLATKYKATLDLIDAGAGAAVADAKWTIAKSEKDTLLVLVAKRTALAEVLKLTAAKIKAFGVDAVKAKLEELK